MCFFLVFSRTKWPVWVIRATKATREYHLVCEQRFERTAFQVVHLVVCVCVYLAGAAAPTNGRVSFLPPFYFRFFSSYFCVKKQRENREEENWAWQEKLWASGCFIDAHREKKNKYLSILFFFFFFLGRFLFCFSTKQSPGVFWIGAGHKNSKLCGAVSCASPSMFGFFSRTS